VHVSSQHVFHPTRSPRNGVAEKDTHLIGATSHPIGAPSHPSRFYTSQFHVAMTPDESGLYSIGVYVYDSFPGHLLHIYVAEHILGGYKSRGGND